MATFRYLITINDYKAIGFMHEDVPDDKIKVLIRRVQDVYLENILGTSLLDKLLDDIENSSLTGHYKTLADKYVRDAVVAFCDYEAVLFLKIKLTAKTVGSMSDEHMQSADDNDTDTIQDKLWKHAVRYANRLRGYLKEYSSDIDEYNNPSTDLDKLQPDREKDSSADFMFVGHGT